MLKAQLRGSRSTQTSTGGITTWKQQSPLEVYEIGKELGRGKFGTTSIAKHLKTGKEYAIKVISKHQPDYNAKAAQSEVEILARLSEHPNIAGLHELYEDGGFRYIVLEMCSGGELFDLIVERGYFTEKEVAVLARTILQVVAHCHSKGILHRDLKPENFLLKHNNGSIEKSNLRAIDFGLSTFHSNGQSCKKVVGSAYYLAPEVLKGHYSWACDAWSAGVMIYIMLSGMPPFWGRTDQEIFGRVLREPLDLKVEPWGSVSQPAKDLVSKLLTRNVANRMSIEDALKHPWIRKLADIPDKPMSSIMLTRLKQFTAMSKFKTLLLNLVAKHLAPTEIGSLRNSFLAMDTDGTGFLTAEKLQAGLAHCSVDASATDMQHLMRHLDVQDVRKGKPAVLSYEDFLAAAVDKQQSLSAQLLSSIFAALDQDGDGFLTAEELSKGLQSADIFAGVEDVMHMMEMETFGDQGSPALERQHNMHKLHRINAAGFMDIIQQSAAGEVQVARLENAARQMSAFAQSNRLRQLASLLTAQHSPAEELHELRELFSDLDEDDSGAISLPLLQSGLQQRCSLTGAEAQQITSALHVNRDGKVDYVRFVASAAAQQNILTDSKLDGAFDLIDVDGDGILTKDDMRGMLTELQVDHTELDSLMQLADTNNKGYVDRQDFELLMRPPSLTKPNLASHYSTSTASSRPQAAQESRRGVASSAHDHDAMHSLMSVMEAKWMSGYRSFNHARSPHQQVDSSGKSCRTD